MYTIRKVDSLLNFRNHRLDYGFFEKIEFHFSRHFSKEFFFVSFEILQVLQMSIKPLI